MDVPELTGRMHSGGGGARLRVADWGVLLDFCTRTKKVSGDVSR